MNKYALLVGVSQYTSAGLRSLERVLDDVAALAALLLHEEVGAFKHVLILENPDRQELEEALETLCRECDRDDLLLFYYSGHGVKDDYGKLHLTNRNTTKDGHGNLRKASATSASWVQDIFKDCRSKRQVIILDCCWSGAIASDWKMKDDGSVAVDQDLGGKGLAILTSSTSTQYSFESDEDGRSIYTRELIEGLRTGKADQNNDGWIQVDELHEYAAEQLRGPKQRMTPEVHPQRQGYKIKVAKRIETPISEQELEQLAKRLKKSGTAENKQNAVAPTQQEESAQKEQEIAKTLDLPLSTLPQEESTLSGQSKEFDANSNLVQQKFDQTAQQEVLEISKWIFAAELSRACVYSAKSFARFASDIASTIVCTILDSKLIHVCVAAIVLIVGCAAWEELRHREPFMTFGESVSTRLKPVMAAIQQAANLSSPVHPTQRPIDSLRMINEALEYQCFLDANPISKEELETKLEALRMRLASSANAGKTVTYSKSVEELLSIANATYHRAYSASQKHEEKLLFGDAAAKYTEIIKLEPNCAEAYNGRGCCEVFSEDFERAKEDFTLAIRLQPTTPGYWRNLGDLFVRIKDMDNAVASYVLSSKFSFNEKTSLAEDGPENRLARKAQGIGDEATAAQRAFTALGPFLIEQIISAEEAGKPELTKTLLSRLEKTAISDAAKGTRLRHEGYAILQTEPLQAREFFYKALLCNLHDDVAWNNLALVYADRKNIPRASACFTLSYLAAQGIDGKYPEQNLIHKSQSGDSLEIKMAATKALDQIRSGVMK